MFVSVSLRCSVELWPPGGDKPPESEYAAVIGRKYFTIKMGLDVFGGERCDLILASLSAPRSVGEQRSRETWAHKPVKIGKNENI